VRVTTAFKRLMDLPGMTVTEVVFEAARVVVTVKLRSGKLCCPECGYSTRSRYDARPVASTWRHLDLGCWRLEVRAVLRRLRCPTHVGLPPQTGHRPTQRLVSPRTPRTRQVTCSRVSYGAAQYCTT